MADFATVDDLAAVWRPLSLAEQAKADNLIPIASSMVRAAAPTIDDLLTQGTMDANLPKWIVCQMVKRVMASGADVSGVTQQSAAVGGVSSSFSFANPTGDMYISKAEKRLIGAWVTRLSTVSMVPGTYVPPHLAEDGLEPVVQALAATVQSLSRRSPESGGSGGSGGAFDAVGDLTEGPLSFGTDDVTFTLTLENDVPEVNLSMKHNTDPDVFVWAGMGPVIPTYWASEWGFGTLCDHRDGEEYRLWASFASREIGIPSGEGDITRQLYIGAGDILIVAGFGDPGTTDTETRWEIMTSALEDNTTNTLPKVVFRVRRVL